MPLYLLRIPEATQTGAPEPSTPCEIFSGRTHLIVRCNGLTAMTNHYRSQATADRCSCRWRLHGSEAARSQWDHRAELMEKHCAVMLIDLSSPIMDVVVPEMCQGCRDCLANQPSFCRGLPYLACAVAGIFFR